jgi:hypothetical protein
MSFLTDVMNSLPTTATGPQRLKPTPLGNASGTAVSRALPKTARVPGFWTRQGRSNLLLALVLAFSGAPAFAQGCQMCYESAKGAPRDGQRALQRAIVVLLVPPLGAMTFGIGLAFRYGKRRDRENGEPSC